MNLFLTCQDDHSNKHLLRFEKKIGEGKFNVYHVYSLTHKANYALKIFPNTSFGTEQHKKELLCSDLRHPSIMQPIPLKCDSRDFYCLMNEYAKYGDLLTFVTTAGSLKNEMILRTYFRFVIEGLEYMHSQGFAHLDLKLENLLLWNDFTIKIIDFDQAQPITDRNMTSGGSKNCRAPEVIEDRCQDLAAADIYSAGVILFAMKTGQFPFVEIEKGDEVVLHLYSLFRKDNKKFWMDKDALLEEGNYFDKDYIKLVNGMLERDVEKRLTIKQIKESKWYQGPVLSRESLKVEMRKLWNNYMANLS